VGRYVIELGEALEARGVDLVRYAVAFGGQPGPQIKRLRIPARLAQASWLRWGRPKLDRLVGPVDLFHATNFVLPPLGNATGVVTIHDLSFLSDDAFPGAERLRSLVPWTVQRAARVIVPTQAIGNEVADWLKLDPAKIAVVHEGVAPDFFSAMPTADTFLGRFGIPGRFAIAVGTIAPRKNLARLLAAWRKADLEDWRLVLAGPKGWGPELPETPGVIPIGWVAHEQLPGLLAAADLFCYPSLYEGFGLPPLEAMAAGTTVLAGRNPAVAEVVGDAAALVDPTDVDAMAGELVRLANDEGERRRLALAGRARATAFTWERTAARTLDVYEAACG
jgi:glycosyltransferase involved in cell wall biosynthesis